MADAIAANETDVLFILDGGDYYDFDDEETDWTAYFQYADGVLRGKIANLQHDREPRIPQSRASRGTAYRRRPIPLDLRYSAGGPLNHAFDCSGVRFVILNYPDPNHANGDDPHTSLALAKSQESWLADQLNNTMLGTFTIHHHPIWDYGRTTAGSVTSGPGRTCMSLQDKSANCAGHTHTYRGTG